MPRTRSALESTTHLAFCVVFAAACATTVNVEVDEQKDFSQYQTWDWMPQTTPRVTAPPDIAPALDMRLRRLIESSLEGRGMRRTEPPADFYVTYHLAVQRKVESFERPVAPYFLSSYSNSTSYWVEGSESAERRIDDIRLAIATTEGGGHMTWQAVLEQRVESPGEIPLESAVAELFGSFPASVPVAAPDTKN